MAYQGRFVSFRYYCTMRMLALVIGLIISACGHTQEVVRTFVLGDTSIDLVVHRSEKPGPLYFNMHDDENTSVDATKEILKKYGGTLYELVHSGNRNIEFYVDSVRYEIDPNRIYTDAGIWRELRRVAIQDSFLMVKAIYSQDSLRLETLRDSLYAEGDSALYKSLQVALLTTGFEFENAQLSIRVPMPPLKFVERDTSVFEMVQGFAKSLLEIMNIDKQDLVVAVHNNTNNRYCLESYLVDSIYQDEAQATYRGFHPDVDEFYFVTERRIYEALQPNHYHIILQDNHRVTDDGSLSVYCALHGIHYVNVEAEHKHEQVQREMIEVMLERLGRR